MKFVHLADRRDLPSLLRSGIRLRKGGLGVCAMPLLIIPGLTPQALQARARDRDDMLELAGRLGVDADYCDYRLETPSLSPHERKRLESDRRIWRAEETRREKTARQLATPPGRISAKRLWADWVRSKHPPGARERVKICAVIFQIDLRDTPILLRAELSNRDGSRALLGLARRFERDGRGAVTSEDTTLDFQSQDAAALNTLMRERLRRLPQLGPADMWPYDIIQCEIPRRVRPREIVKIEAFYRTSRAFKALQGRRRRRCWRGGAPEIA